MKRSIIITLLASAGLTASAQTVQDRVMEADTFLTAPASISLANPAMAGYRLQTGISEISAGFEQQGGVNRRGYFEAQTFLRSGHSTIEGHASYHNGFRLNSGIYENADPQLLYPYLTADEVGGRLDDEIYSFGGTYNTSLADSTWLIGVEGSYTALLECRRRDPRPKNTVGDLNVAVGGARRAGNYWVALGVSARKYKQTNEISFVSELGESKIYHTIGMGAQYSRFAGASRNSSYSGHSFGATANLFPLVDQGVFATVDFNRFSFNKILTNLNRLPLAHAAQNTLTAQVGYKGAGFTASVSVESGLRKGTENIFGDPMGNVYPEIASLTTYSGRSLRAGVAGAYALRAGRSRWDFALRADCDKMRQKYLGFADPRIMDVANMDAALDVAWLRAVSGRVTVRAGVDGSLSGNLTSKLEGMPAELTFMEQSTVTEYEWFSARKSAFGVNAGVDVSVSRSIAVGLRLSGGRTYISGFKSRTNYNFALCMVF